MFCFKQINSQFILRQYALAYFPVCSEFDLLPTGCKTNLIYY